MGFTYKVLQEKYKKLRQNEKDLNKEIEKYKYLYKDAKEDIDILKKKLKEKDIIIDMFYKMYYWK